MSKMKNVNKKAFDKLPYNERVKEIKAMAKRANVRMSLLEESGIINEVYNQADRYNTNLGRKNNRFYEGTKYKTHDQLNDAYNALSNFLNNKKSTLGGIQSDISNKLNNIIHKGQVDNRTLRGLSEKELTYIASESSKIANKKLSDLEKANIDYYAYDKAQHYNEATGRKNNRFYRGKKFGNIKEAMAHIQNVFNFLNAESSTPQGVENIHNRRIDKFRTKGVNIPTGKETEFYDFLSSNQFKKLGEHADSNQIVETFVDARNIGVDVEEINQAFAEYLTSDMSIDEVQEKLKVAKWQKGGLLK